MLDQLKLEGLNNAQWLKVRLTKQCVMSGN